VDDVPLQPEAGMDWRAQVAYVAQDPVLFDDTIRENLLWAVNRRRPRRQMRAALADAAADFVWALPDGLDTPSGTAAPGSREASVSGSRWRGRCSAVPHVLVLDEATSALDAEHEQRIQQAIERLHGRITIVVITHRLATVRHADVIHVSRPAGSSRRARWTSCWLGPLAVSGSSAPRSTCTTPCPRRTCRTRAGSAALTPPPATQ
jgi:ATP-binding cassette, subfamily C, bacterial